MPSTSVTRPDMFGGPMLRQSKVASTTESSGTDCAAAPLRLSRSAVDAASRRNFMELPRELGSRGRTAWSQARKHPRPGKGASLLRNDEHDRNDDECRRNHC